jgi:hypothetical protein
MELIATNLSSEQEQRAAPPSITSEPAAPAGDGRRFASARGSSRE